MPSDQSDPLARVHELHGQSILAARDAEPGEDRHTYMAQAEAFEHVLAVFEDDWEPFDETPLREEFRQVSQAVLAADRVNSEVSDREPIQGLE